MLFWLGSTILCFFFQKESMIICKITGNGALCFAKFKHTDMLNDSLELLLLYKAVHQFGPFLLSVVDQSWKHVLLWIWCREKLGEIKTALQGGGKKQPTC